MNAVLAQRKYHLAARLANDTARTLGLWLTAAFVVLVVTSAILDAATEGQTEELATYVLLALPIAMFLAGWLHLSKGYPLAIVHGFTRKEFLAGFALYGLATVVTAAALTQAGRLILEHLPTADSEIGFYGRGPLDSLARSALWFTVGAAAGAAKLRFPGRRLGVLASALLVAAVVYRPVAISLMRNLAQDTPFGDGTLVEVPVEMTMNHLALIDLAFTVPLALLTWALLARAPMHPKSA
ncbi:hypothetical protein [Glycomyces tritici]|uniref:Uncharacterized protein n=1 Tax=Glycomyces tritici TaxID=2665176 RepID=A0ABT7YKS0_9ACTN|nr:hypothetical protein [Glycomyces tritici]MDN3239206.1 hypothetical protein [Glycomyces tritici]